MTRRGTTTVAPPLPEEVGQGPSDTGWPLTVVQDPWSAPWSAPTDKALAHTHALARRRERLLARRGHSAPTDPATLESLPDPGGTRSRIAAVLAALAGAYWYYTLATIGITMILPLLIGWSTSTVATGSMEPALSPGDVVAFAGHDGAPLPVGSIIRFDDPSRPGETITHRIVSIRPDETYETKGDANAAADSTAVDPASITGVARMVAPHAGLPRVWAGSGDWSILTAWMVITVAAGSAIGMYGRTALPRRRIVVFRPALAAGLIAAIAGVGTAAWSSAAFAAQSGNSANSFEAAASFGVFSHGGGAGIAVCSPGTTTTITLTSAIEAGDTVIVRFALTDVTTSSPYSAYDSAGNIYVLDAVATNGTRAEAAILRAPVTTGLDAGDEISVTHPAGQGTSLAVDVFGGIAMADPVVTTATGSDNSRTPSLTASAEAADRLVIGQIAADNATTVTQPAGWSPLSGGTAACGRRVSIASAWTDTIDSSDITYAPGFSNSRRWAGVLVVYDAG